MKLAAKRVVWGLLGLALVGGAGWWGWPDAAATKVSLGTAPSGEGAAFVHSMQDTVPDGDLRTAPGARPALASDPLPYAELKRLFDYYLSAVGEQSIDAITLAIAHDLERRLSPPQVPAAKRLLALYLQFKLGLVELDREKHFKRIADSNVNIVLPYEHLFAPTAARIMAGILGVPFDPARHDLLVQMRIEPMWRHIHVGKEAVGALMKKITEVR